MIYLIILAFGFLLAVNHAISKNFLYPPTLFTAVWLISLIGLALSGDTFYSISVGSLLVYFVGALVFSFGGLLTLSGPEVNRLKKFSLTPLQIAKIHKFLDFIFLVVLVGLPFYWLSVMKNVDFSNSLFLAEQRIASVERQAYNPLGNLVIIAMLMAIGMHITNDGSYPRKWRAYLAIVLALIYGSMTGTKGNAVKLLIILVFLSFMRAGRINFRVLVSMIALVLAFFATALFFVNYAYMDLSVSMESVRLLAEAIQNYWLGGLVAFERIVQSPESLVSNQPLHRFFLETANSLGASYSLPPLHADYTRISPTQDTNTYTIYFSYFKDYGWIGLVLGLSTLGGILTWIYRLARHGNPLAIVFYSMNVSGIILSIHAEHFALGLNLYIKTFIFIYVMYYISPRLPILKHSIRGRQSA